METFNFIFLGSIALLTLWTLRSLCKQQTKTTDQIDHLGSLVAHTKATSSMIGDSINDLRAQFLDSAIAADSHRIVIAKQEEENLYPLTQKLGLIHDKVHLLTELDTVSTQHLEKIDQKIDALTPKKRLLKKVGK